jgi:hypothetical protein
VGSLAVASNVLDSVLRRRLCASAQRPACERHSSACKYSQFAELLAGSDLVVRCWVRAPGAQANALDVSVYNAWPVSLVARSVADAQRAGVPGAGLSPQPAANHRVADSWHLTATWAFAGINQQPMRDSNSWSVQLGVEV